MVALVDRKLAYARTVEEGATVKPKRQDGSNLKALLECADCEGCLEPKIRPTQIQHRPM